MDAQTIKVGDTVNYVDPIGQARKALVTAVWGDSKPSLNLVFVTTDKTMTDSYGQQTGRMTSVVHKSAQQAHGNYWE